MTQEEKAKAYDGAREKIAVRFGINVAEEIFSEFEDSEDERIRKAIIEFFKSQDDNTTYSLVPKKDIIAWLEKQKQVKNTNKENEEVRQYIIRTMKQKDINVPMVRKALAWLEKQAEKKQEQYDIDVLEKHITKDSISELAHTVIVRNGWEIVDLKEQKPAENVQLKFKVGDWITDGYVGGQITSIEYSYPCYKIADFMGGINSSIPFSLQDNYHLWTIADAKDGDMIVDKSDGSIGIFQSIGHHPDGGSYNDPSYCFLHCRYDDGFFFEDFEDGNTMNSGDVIPATKEQRDLLFAKMKEAGYEWDADKKELKKIEQKPSAWGKEDDIMLRDILGWLPAKSRPEYNQIRVEWLKSLKQRIGWKPSDEQITVLELASKYERVFTPKQIDILIGLKEQLKKLTE